MALASKYGSMMLSRAAARPSSFAAAPLVIRSFSTTMMAAKDKPKEEPTRRNPLIGGSYGAPRPPPVSTEKPVASQPPHPDKAPVSSAEVPPNQDLPIPTPPPPPTAAAAEAVESKATDPLTKTLKPGQTYNATSRSPDFVDIPNILEDVFLKSQSVGTTSDPTKLPRVRTAPVAGRTIHMETPAWSRGTAHSPEHAFVKLRQLMSESKINRLFNQQRFHERPGLKRKRLKMERWRARFKKGFRATAERVKELKKQGW